MNTGRKKRISQIVAFGIIGLFSFIVAGFLFTILGYILYKGLPVISWEFLTGMPTEGMTSGGIFPAIVGTLALITGSMIFALPVGVLSGIYLNEYASNGRIKKFITIMTDNLAGVPSIVFGLFGMALFVKKLDFGDSILAGSLTLGLLTLPVIIRTTEEALKSVDETFRMGSLALGATKWQTIYKVVLPVALPNIITGLILSIGRISGETAPILFTAAAYFLPRLPDSIFDQVMALPYHLYVISTSGINLEKSRMMAYGTAVVLIAIVLLSNLAATIIRNYLSRKYKSS